MENYEYDYPLYRPPSEAYSLILQITLGCSHNKCTFCNMYKSKKFKIKPIEQIKEEINWFRKKVSYAEKIFLADGDALIIPTFKLIEILEYINKIFPENERIAIYASPKSLKFKTKEELKEIRKKGVTLIYLGLESGDEEILTKTNKGSTPKEIIKAGKKAKESGFKLSLTIIMGLGGKDKSESHALKTAEVINQIIPDYLGALCLTLLPETEMFKEAQLGKFNEISGLEMIEELKIMLENINIKTKEKIIFRSNHVSNYLNLRGELPKDKQNLLKEINFVLNNNKKIEREKRQTL